MEYHKKMELVRLADQIERAMNLLDYDVPKERSLVKKLAASIESIERLTQIRSFSSEK